MRLGECVRGAERRGEAGIDLQPLAQNALGDAGRRRAPGDGQSLGRAAEGVRHSGDRFLPLTGRAAQRVAQCPVHLLLGAHPGQYLVGPLVLLRLVSRFVLHPHTPTLR